MLANFVLEWKLADTGNNGFVCLSNITDEYAMTFSNSMRKLNRIKIIDLFKVYTMSEMPNRICMFI